MGEPIDDWLAQTNGIHGVGNLLKLTVSSEAIGGLTDVPIDPTGYIRPRPRQCGFRCRVVDMGHKFPRDRDESGPAAVESNDPCCENSSARERSRYIPTAH